MSESDDACLRMLTRAYCYLRLAAVPPSVACRQLQQLAGAIAEVGEAGDAHAGVWPRLWDECVEATARSALDAAAEAGPSLPPELVRGHIGYVNFGG